MTEFERYLDDFGDRLGAATAGPHTRRRRHVVVLAMCGAAVAAVAVAAVLAATGERLDPVAEARAALASPGAIIYMKITSETISPAASSVPPPLTTVQWSALDPLRWRLVQTMRRPSRGSGGMFDAHGAVFGRMELSYGHGQRRQYLAERDTLEVTTGYEDDEPAARIPSLLGQGSGNPQADLRSMLTDAQVTDEGERRVGDHTMRRFVSVPKREDDLRFRLILDVDPETFAPLQATISIGDRGDRPRVVTRLQVDEYKRIPLDDTTVRLLEIQTTPQTKTAEHTIDELRERGRQLQAKCRPLKSGGLTCPPPHPPPRVP